MEWGAGKLVGQAEDLKTYNFKGTIWIEVYLYKFSH